jgi:hypothetical protein
MALLLDDNVVLLVVGLLTVTLHGTQKTEGQQPSSKSARRRRYQGTHTAPVVDAAAPDLAQGLRDRGTGGGCVNNLCQHVCKAGYTHATCGHFSFNANNSSLTSPPPPCTLNWNANIGLPPPLAFLWESFR